MKSTLLFLLLSVVAASDQPPQCSFECYHDSVCAAGPADFGDHPTKTNGDPLDIHVVTQRDGMHCACHPGYTGLYCERKYEDCGYAEHKCYHGGKCILGLNDIYGNSQLFCDCSDAKDENGVEYVGKFCETAKVQSCGNDTSAFCVNGGWCKEDYQNYPRRPCHCGTSYEGPHCEFESGAVPKCTLLCQNGGACRLGIKDFLPGNSEFLYDFWKSHSNYQYCECSSAYNGLYCEVESDMCGDHHCFHGGECITVTQGSKHIHHCDCTRAHAKDVSYGGKYCQYEANSLCDQEQTVNGKLFCVNGGTCIEQGSQLGCNCPDGFHGPICEFADLNVTSAVAAKEVAYEKCTLQCQNGGQCRNGVKDVTFLNQFGQDVAHLNQTHDGNVEHCVCLDGFVGLTCDTAVQVCPSGVHACFHGSTCVTNVNNTDACNCESGSTPYSKLAGMFCQHKSTSICTEGGSSSTFAFCVNDGTCVDIIGDDNKEHPGCDCSEAFEGPHCEFLKSNEGGGEDVGESPVDDAPNYVPKDETVPQEYIPEDQPGNTVQSEVDVKDTLSSSRIQPNSENNNNNNNNTGSNGKKSLSVGALSGIAVAAAIVSMIGAMVLYREKQMRKSRQVEDAIAMSENRLVLLEEPERKHRQYRDFLAEYDIPDMGDNLIRPTTSYHDIVFENIEVL